MQQDGFFGQARTVCLILQLLESQAAGGEAAGGAGRARPVGRMEPSSAFRGVIR